MDRKKIKIGGRPFTPEELGLKRITIDGHMYLDITPLWIDSVQSERIREITGNTLKVQEPGEDEKGCDKK